MIKVNELAVLDSLTVHDLLVEPRRIKATYTITNKEGESNSSQLIYSYDFPLFDSNSFQDVNLASMMAVQVALNYGLFFRKIIFDGLFDSIDQRFLVKMLENTSREILVNKFLVKNEFLKTPFDRVIPEKKDKYTNAELIFENSAFQRLKKDGLPGKVDYDHYAILSSGGKDSLLTYGLIKEIGEPHPIFINESGRHWFTAINAYRHYQEIEPNTHKPWCNSDRIFNWMVRQMPFVKDNFQNIRADIYPIRLWTVAVFLFGVLPVVRKKKIGNILIGNEYDTTLRGNYQGISHYNGLYDQSKYFDNALTRYFHQKGWNIYQYSVLRSLSELLILKVLVKRYPNLQVHQVSCHAAHDHQGRMFPCGKCEKCRRIIGMLKALGEDPKRCGYTEEQIQNGLNALAQKNVKQIGSDSNHLFHILLAKGMIPENEHTLRLAKPHPEIMKLRFDNERSMLADMPIWIRKKVLGIYEKYSDGYVQLKNKRWNNISKLDLHFEGSHFLNKKMNEK